MKVFLLNFSILLPFSVVAQFISGSQCPEDQVSCLSESLPSRTVCLERDSLCFDGAPSTVCRADVLQNVSLQCSSTPPRFVCSDQSETFPLQVLCNGMGQCSDNSDENNLLCEGIPQLPFLISNAGTPVVELQSTFLNGSLEGSVPINHPTGFPFGSSIQNNLYVSTSGYISFGADFNVDTPVQLPSSSLSYIVAPFWTATPRFDDESSMSRVRCYEYSEMEGKNSSENILQDVANFIKRMRPNITSFKPTWMLVCEWSTTRISFQNYTFQALVITDGADMSFTIFTYECTCNFLRWPDSAEDLPVTIGFQGEADFYALYPLSYWNETQRPSELACTNGSAVDWCNLVYQLAPKPASDANISIVKDTQGYVVGQSSTTVCKTVTDLLIVKVQWFRNGNDIAISNSTVLKLNISEGDNDTVYHCRATAMQGTLEASFTLIINSPLQSVSSSTTHIKSEVPITNEISVVSDSDDPPSHSKNKDMSHILTGGVVVGVVFVSVALLTLFSIYFRKRKLKHRISNKLMYSFNSNKEGATEHTDEANWMGDPEAGLIIATMTSKSNPSFSEVQVLCDHRGRPEIPFSSLDLQEKMGNGTFGAIFKGTFRNLAYPHRQPKPCVVKLLKSTATKVQKNALLSQLVLMQYAESHPHLLKLLGCCTTGDRIALIVEYCPLGSLRGFLTRNRRKFQQVSSRRPSNITLDTPSSFYSRTQFNWSLDTEEICLVEQAALRLSELGNGRVRINSDEQEEEEYDDIEISLHTLLDFGRQITLGMEHLSQKKIVHRNLAARNILVSQEWQLKISDFGIYHDDLYSQEGSGKIPLRWMALETILHRQYTTMSDIWSFGVVLWEILTLGTFPYLDSSNSEVLEKLKSGYRMPKPENCPQCLYVSPLGYELILSCWDEDPLARPSFRRARQHLDQVISTTEEAEEYLLLVSGELIGD